LVLVVLGIFLMEELHQLLLKAEIQFLAQSLLMAVVVQVDIQVAITPQELLQQVVQVVELAPLYAVEAEELVQLGKTHK
jgi:hypothetical protein